MCPGSLTLWQRLSFTNVASLDPHDTPSPMGYHLAHVQTQSGDMARKRQSQDLKPGLLVF